MLYAGTTSAVLKGDVLEKLYGVSLSIIRKKGRYWPMAE
jgi:hypothetical protein